MVRIAEMKHKMKLINLLISLINYFATEPKSSCDRRRQWIDRDEKRDCLHQQSEGRETRAWEITRLGLRIRVFFGRKRGTKPGMWKWLQFGENKGKSNVDFQFFFLNPQPREFSEYYKWDILLINIETLLGWWP